MRGVNTILPSSILASSGSPARISRRRRSGPGRTTCPFVETLVCMVRRSYLHRADFATHHLQRRPADKIFNAFFTTRPSQTYFEIFELTSSRNSSRASCAMSFAPTICATLVSRKDSTTCTPCAPAFRSLPIALPPSRPPQRARRLPTAPALGPAPHHRFGPLSRHQDPRHAHHPPTGKFSCMAALPSAAGLTNKSTRPFSPWPQPTPATISAN